MFGALHIIALSIVKLFVYYKHELKIVKYINIITKKEPLLNQNTQLTLSKNKKSCFPLGT